MDQSRPTPSTTLELKCIDELLSYDFVIPSYQRGYRWTERQVTELLDDLHEFQCDRDQRPRGAFYCLQPIVVRPRDDGTWELIDGQQRLTTILLVLRFLDEVMVILDKQRYGLTYETRKRSAEFLENLDPAQSEDNIDFHHIYRAHEAIRAWFGAHDGTAKFKLLTCMLDPDDRNVKVIWYQLPSSEDPVEVFIRLNVGKIPLTNGELIRAMFLKEQSAAEGPSTDRRVQISHEWDGIEKRLRDESFWHFVHRGPSPYPARIEYLFAVRVLELALPVPEHDEYATFIAYARHFREEGKPETVENRWREIRHLFQRLDEWWQDRALYHLVGFCIATADKSSQAVLVDLLAKRSSLTRSAFDRNLRERIFDELFGADLSTLDPEGARRVIGERLDELSYATSGHHPAIRAVLLLFNVATLLRNPTSTLRFPFDLYELQPWDIEHIRSVKSDMPGRIDDQKSWLRTVIEYWGDTPDDTSAHALRDEAEVAVQADPFDTIAFKDLYWRVLEHFGEADEDMEIEQGLSNLALLDASTNRSYKNAVFPVKRRRVLQLDKEGTYVPLCTTNAFLKYYSSKIDNMMFWSSEDSRNYREAMIEVLHHFACGAV